MNFSKILIQKTAALDTAGYFQAADTLCKLALDLSNAPELGAGSYGKFYNNLNKDEFKKEIGTYEPNIGIKQFYKTTHEPSQNAYAEEYLWINFLSKIINNNTNLKVPTSGIYQRYSGFFQNPRLFMHTIHGKLLSDALRFWARDYDPGVLTRIKSMVYFAVEHELHKIGVVWNDIHAQNIMLSHKSIREIDNYLKAYDNAFKLEIGADTAIEHIQNLLINQIYLFDFGFMTVVAHGPVYDALVALYNQIEPINSKQYNKYLNILLNSIRVLLRGVGF